jgi:hypothetical protein
VLFTQLAIFPTTDDPAATSQVTIELTRKNGERGRPQVRVDAGVPMNGDMSVRDLQLALLEQTLFLLKRIVTEAPESLHEKWVRFCDEARSDHSSTVSVGGVTVSVKEG